MAVPLTDTVTWLNESHPVDGTYEHVSVYLIDAGGRYILVDSGSFHHREALREAIDEATDGVGIDALVLSHSDYPHSANVRAFRQAWGDVELVASSGAPEVQGLPPDARRGRIGGELSVLGRRFSFIDPPLADRSHTTWIYDHESAVLFTADGFGSQHDLADRDNLSSDFDDGIAYETIYEFHRDTLVWLRYVDPEKLRLALERILDAFPPSYVAPIHGHPVAAADLDDYLAKLLRAADRIAAEYEVPRPAE